MVTDRMTTIGFLTFLSNLYKEYVFFFGVIIYLDILSHWMLMMATFQNNSQNHKQQHFKSWILTQFYKNRFTLTLLCFGNEVLIHLFIFILYYFYSLLFFRLSQFSYIFKDSLRINGSSLIIPKLCVFFSLYFLLNKYKNILSLLILLDCSFRLIKICCIQFNTFR